VHIPNLIRLQESFDRKFSDQAAIILSQNRRFSCIFRDSLAETHFVDRHKK